MNALYLFILLGFLLFSVTMINGQVANEEEPGLTFDFIRYLENPVYYRDLNAPFLNELPFLNPFHRDTILSFLGRKPSPDEFSRFLKEMGLHEGIRPFIRLYPSSRSFRLVVESSSSEPIQSSVSFRLEHNGFHMDGKIKESSLSRHYFPFFIAYRKPSLTIFLGNYFFRSSLGLLSNHPLYSRPLNGTQSFWQPVFSSAYPGLTGIGLSISRGPFTLLVNHSQTLFYAKQPNDTTLQLYSDFWYIPANSDTSFRMNVTIVALQSRVNSHWMIGGMYQLPSSGFPIPHHTNPFHYLMTEKYLLSPQFGSFLCYHSDSLILQLEIKGKSSCLPAVSSFMQYSSCHDISWKMSLQYLPPHFGSIFSNPAFSSGATYGNRWIHFTRLEFPLHGLPIHSGRLGLEAWREKRLLPRYIHDPITEKKKLLLDFHTRYKRTTFYFGIKWYSKDTIPSNPNWQRWVFGSILNQPKGGEYTKTEIGITPSLRQISYYFRQQLQIRSRYWKFRMDATLFRLHPQQGRIYLFQYSLYQTIPWLQLHQEGCKFLLGLEFYRNDLEIGLEYHHLVKKSSSEQQAYFGIRIHS